jgi:hypothetical protein
LDFELIAAGDEFQHRYYITRMGWGVLEYGGSGVVIAERLLL